MRMKDKVAIITGAASGIGQGAALLFADEGARVVVADIDPRGGKKTVAAITRKKGKHCSWRLILQRKNQPRR